MRVRLAILGTAGVLLLGACGPPADTGVDATTRSADSPSGVSGSYDYGDLDNASDEAEDDPQVRADAYNQAWDDACANVWSNSGNGGLYYGGAGYSEDDCTDAKPSVDGTEFEDEDEATAQGEDDGYDGAFDLSPADELCYGPDCWDETDY